MHLLTSPSDTHLCHTSLAPAPVQAFSRKSAHSVHQSYEAATIIPMLQMETLQIDAQRDLRASSTTRKQWIQEKALLTLRLLLLLLFCVPPNSPGPSCARHRMPTVSLSTCPNHLSSLL